MIYLLSASILVMLVSLVGVFSTWKGIGKIVEKNLGFLVSFSAGVFFIIAYNLGQEAIEHSTLREGAWWTILGALVILAVFNFLPGFHHHHNKEKEDTHSGLDIRRILISDGVHNFVDGILLATAFAVSVSFGVITTVSVVIHEIVQEISEFFVLRGGGLSTKRALVLNFLVSGTILFGALGGYFLFEEFEHLEVPLLGIASGSFLIVVFHDLIPHSIRSTKNRTQYAKHIGWFILGLILMFLVNFVFGH